MKIIIIKQKGCHAEPRRSISVKAFARILRQAQDDTLRCNLLIIDHQLTNHYNATN